MFGLLVAVVGNQGVGGLGDCLCGTVVLFEFKDFQVGVVTAQIEYVGDVGASEGVDTLCVITHEAHSVVGLAQLQYDTVLGKVGVLVFVYEQVGKVVAVSLPDVGVVAQQHVGEHEQVVEVHRAGHTATVAVGGVDVGGLGPVGQEVLLPQLIVGGVEFG